MARTRRPWSTWVLASLLALPLRAQPDDPGAGFSDLGGGPARNPGIRIVRPPRPFVLGRDNIAFPNPSGAVRIQGMAGNCYAMSAVTRLFHEAARFRPEPGEGATRGLDWRALAAALRSPDPARVGFGVSGAASLHAFSTVPGVAASRADDWLDSRIRAELGIGDPTTPGGVPAEARGASQVFQLVSVIHYLHYMQFQSQHFLKSAVLDRLQGASSHQRATQEAARTVISGLPRQDLALLMVFNPRQVYGHVVLAYQAEVHPDGTVDLVFYDNNVQYGDVTVETLFRVGPDGSFHPYRRAPGSDRLIDDEPNWAGSRFWDRQRMSLHVLPSLDEDPELRRSLAAKVEMRDLELAYLMLAGEYLTEVTQKAPGEASLFASTRRLVHRVESAQDRLGRRPAWRTASLGSDASVEALNAHLARYGDRGLQEAVPYVLPRGLTLTGSRLRFDPADPNRAEVRTTLTIDHSQPIEKVVTALRDSVALASDPALATLVGELASTFAGEQATLSVRLALEKGRSPDPNLGPYAPVPTLLASRLTLGRIPPSPLPEPFQGHRVELSEELATKLLRAVLRSQSVLGAKFTFAYGFDPPLAPRIEREGELTVRDVGFDFRPGSAGLWADLSGFAPVATRTRGVSFRSERVTLTLVGTLPGERRLRLTGSLSGPLDLETGLGGLGDRLVTDVLGALFAVVFPRFEAGLADFVTAQLGTWVTLVPGSRVKLSSPSVSHRGISARLDPVTLDLAGTVRRLFGSDLPVRLVGLSASDDRLVLELAPAGP